MLHPLMLQYIFFSPGQSGNIFEELQTLIQVYIYKKKLIKPYPCGLTDKFLGGGIARFFE